jgi:hypothetical protein
MRKWSSEMERGGSYCVIDQRNWRLNSYKWYYKQVKMALSHYIKECNLSIGIVLDNAGKILMDNGRSGIL